MNVVVIVDVPNVFDVFEPKRYYKGNPFRDIDVYPTVMQLINVIAEIYFQIKGKQNADNIDNSTVKQKRKGATQGKLVLVANVTNHISELLYVAGTMSALNGVDCDFTLTEGANLCSRSGRSFLFLFLSKVRNLVNCLNENEDDECHD